MIIRRCDICGAESTTDYVFWNKIVMGEGLTPNYPKIDFDICSKCMGKYIIPAISKFANEEKEKE